MHTIATRRRLPALMLVFLWLAMIAVPAGPATAEEPAIEGYTDQLSYRPGEKVAFHLSAKAAQARVKIQRIGGENRVVLEQDGITIGSHPMPVKASSDGCNWPVAWSFAVPADWKSGVYEAAFTPAAGGKPAVIHFMVRSAQPGKTSKILFQLSTNTWNAYTNSGGHSLYSYHDVAGLQGHRVSFNRPQHSGMINSWEVPFLRWAERSGYTLDYAANSDLEFHPEELAGYRLVLSVGHDEYWSSPMRDHLEAFIKNGGNVAFFSGNTCCWQVRSEDGGRALTCWKQFFNMDPLYRNGDQRLLSTLWSHHLVGRPENELTGVGFLWGGYHLSHGEVMDGDGAYQVHQPDHWVFEDTRLARDAKFGGEQTIVGYECDGCELEWREGLPYATGRDGTPENFTVVATAPASWDPSLKRFYDRMPLDRAGHAVMGLYTRGGTVFTCGSTDWAHGLNGKNPTVERITRNILDRLGK